MPVVRVVEAAPASLDAYCRVPMTLEVRSTYRVEVRAGSIELTEQPVAMPWTKDFDAIEEERPVNLPLRYNLTRWGIFAAYDGDLRVGGAIAAPPGDAWFTKDGAGLVDIRVAPSARRRGVGRALFQAAIAWARERNLPELVIESQNINVPSCRLYASQGAILADAHFDAYPSFPNEVRLIWKLAL
jgi:GNAT superfamily N-acetyltransferase